MARVLIRMKLRVLRHSLKGKRAALFAIGLVYGIIAGVVSALVPLAAGANLEAGTDVVAALFAVWALGWVVGPVLTGGGDETLRPENFALLPITSRALARAMLAASFIGVPAAATLVGFLGIVVVGATAGVVPALIGVIGVVGELGFVIVCHGWSSPHSAPCSPPGAGATSARSSHPWSRWHSSPCDTCSRPSGPCW